MEYMRTNVDSVMQLLESCHPHAFLAVQAAAAGEASASEAGPRPGSPAATAPNFCKCGNCSTASVGLERCCCRQEVGLCFTETRRFQVVVLGNEVVRTAVNLELHTEWDHFWSYDAASMRYQAYRQFVYNVTGPTGLSDFVAKQ